MTRNGRRPWIAFLSTLLLLWMQFAVTAFACPRDAAPMVHDHASMHCGGTMHDENTPLCEAHCEQASQSAQTPTFDLPPVALLPLWSLPTEVSKPGHAALAPATPFPLAGAFPPLRLQYQVFRI